MANFFNYTEISGNPEHWLFFNGTTINDNVNNVKHGPRFWHSATSTQDYCCCINIQDNGSVERYV